jgi:hypothetical protein
VSGEAILVGWQQHLGVGLARRRAVKAEGSPCRRRGSGRDWCRSRARSTYALAGLDTSSPTGATGTRPLSPRRDHPRHGPGRDLDRDPRAVTVARWRSPAAAAAGSSRSAGGHARWQDPDRGVKQLVDHARPAIEPVAATLGPSFPAATPPPQPPPGPPSTSAPPRGRRPAADPRRGQVKPGDPSPIPQRRYGGATCAPAKSARPAEKPIPTALRKFRALLARSARLPVYRRISLRIPRPMRHHAERSRSLINSLLMAHF